MPTSRLTSPAPRRSFGLGSKPVDGRWAAIPQPTRPSSRRREPILAAAAVAPAIADEDVAELRRIAEDLGRAARIRERTEARFAETLQARVAASTGVALHPDRRADRSRRRGRRRAGRAGRRGGARPPSVPIRARRPSPPLDGRAGAGRPRGSRRPSVADVVPASPRLERVRPGGLERRRSRVRAVADRRRRRRRGPDPRRPRRVSPRSYGGVLAAGLLLAALELWRGRRAARTVTVRAEEAEQQSDRLASVGAAVAATDSGRRAAALGRCPRSTREALAGRSAVALDADRDDAEEQLRVARNRWHQLAGPTADPHDVEAVIQGPRPPARLQPRPRRDVPDRADAWPPSTARPRPVGRCCGPPSDRSRRPDPEQLEAVLDDLLGEHRRAVADAQALAEAEARVAAAEEVHRPIVLAEPSAWLTPDQLAAAPGVGAAPTGGWSSSNGAGRGRARHEAGPADDEASEAS